MKTITVTPFDVSENGAHLPENVYLEATPLDGLKKVATSHLSGPQESYLALVDIAAYCEKNNFPAAATETDQEILDRWAAGIKHSLGNELTSTGMQRTRDDIHYDLGMHTDSHRLVSMMLRINSSTLGCKPADTRDMILGSQVDKAVAEGSIGLNSFPYGHIGFFSGRFWHSWPASRINPWLGNAKIVGPHLPEPDKKSFGYLLSWANLPTLGIY